eukprot:EC722701.1.p1 GENE.EC722701.1~~EC722701.1.p1  ORF type:complete len:84 (+),score=10.31 EC722701.1:95-346(+)
MLLVDLMRLPLGNRGNKTEQAGPTVLFLILSLLLGIGCAYYIALETFVLFVDLILNGIYFVFLGGEVLLSVFAAITFYNSVPV